LPGPLEKQPESYRTMRTLQPASWLTRWDTLPRSAASSERVVQHEACSRTLRVEPANR